MSAELHEKRALGPAHQVRIDGSCCTCVPLTVYAGSTQENDLSSAIAHGDSHDSTTSDSMRRRFT